MVQNRSRRAAMGDDLHAAVEQHRLRQPAVEIGSPRLGRISSITLALHLAALQARFVVLVVSFCFSSLVPVSIIVVFWLETEAEYEVGEGRGSSVAVAAFDSILREDEFWDEKIHEQGIKFKKKTIQQTLLQEPDKDKHCRM
ncbi:hypothetical protein QQ045_012689 [Rhodiola kirilowii]